MELSEGIKYYTRNHTPVVIYTLDAGGDYPIHGAYYNGNEWIPKAWDVGGFHNPDGPRHPMDIDWENTEIDQPA